MKRKKAKKTRKRQGGIKTYAMCKLKFAARENRLTVEPKFDISNAN